jgi:2-oxoglutarate dehydrogenase E2 component (dihydrolipoamide succinyltransferase)
MPIELTVPSVGESVTEVEVGDWLKQVGEPVRKDEAVVVIETDKATMEIFAPTDGVIGRVTKPKGSKVTVGDVVGYLDPAGAASAPPAQPHPPTSDDVGSQPREGAGGAPPAAPHAPASGPAAEPPAAPAPASAEPRVMPAAARVIAERGIAVDSLTGTGPGGRVLKEDAEAATVAPPPAPPAQSTPSSVTPTPPTVSDGTGRSEEVVPLSLIRRKIAERLLAAQNTMALLTTFNEVDMSAILALRAQFQEKFQERYRIKLGFMSFFVKAVIEALKDLPALNAEIRGESMVYRNYYDIGIAIGGGRGLVVPVLRHAERLGFAAIEQAIAEFATRAKENKLTPADLTGGTFTITNGGVYGSLLSTPLINAPQSGVLGLHAIQERPVARDGQVVIRPMMYVALTYDHRIVDGREAVTFLRRVKELTEHPARILLEA